MFDRVALQNVRKQATGFHCFNLELQFTHGNDMSCNDIHSLAHDMLRLRYKC